MMSLMRHPAVHVALIVLIAAFLTLVGRGCSSDREAPPVAEQAADTPAPAAPAEPAADDRVGETAPAPAADRDESEQLAAARAELAPVEEPLPEDEVAASAARGPLLVSGLDDGAPDTAAPAPRPESQPESQAAPRPEAEAQTWVAPYPASDKLGPCQKRPPATAAEEEAAAPTAVSPQESTAPEAAASDTAPTAADDEAEQLAAARAELAPLEEPLPEEAVEQSAGRGPMVVSGLDDGAPVTRRIMRRGGEPQPEPSASARLAASMDDGAPAADPTPGDLADHREQHARGIEHGHEAPAAPGPRLAASMDEAAGAEAGHARHVERMQAGMHADLSHVRLEPPGYPPPEHYRQGKNLYEQHCHGCHGDRGAGTDHGPPLLHPYYDPNDHGDEYFYDAVANGAEQHLWQFGNMPPLPQVERDEVTEIIGYVRWLQRQVNIY